MGAMAGLSRGNFMTLGGEVRLSRNTKPSVTLVEPPVFFQRSWRKNILTCDASSFDLPAVEPIARKTIAREGLSDRIQTAAGDFFKDGLPKADVVTMGMILHDWNLEKKKHLIKAAYKALPENGAFIAVENIIDDERRENAFGLLMSLNMLIEFGDAFDFSGADFWSWCKEAGFKSYEVLHLAGPCSAAIAYK